MEDTSLIVLRKNAETVLLRSKRTDRSNRLILQPASDLNPEGLLERMERECGLTRSLDPTHVLQALELIEIDGMPALTFVDAGGNIPDSDAEWPLATDDLLVRAAALAASLEHIHANGVVHCDLKPDNLLFSPSGNVRLTGFGHARLMDESVAAASLQDRSQGFERYAAPETTGRGHRTADQRSDLYSLGIVLYQMLTGRLPFAARDRAEWVHSHMARQPAAPGRFVPSAPTMLAAIIMKLIEKAPEDRYQTARGLARDLARCLTEWKRHGRIDSFVLRSDDSRGRFAAPKKLYGRDAEIAQLAAIHDQTTAESSTRLLFVSGYSGIGKSSLVAELQHHLDHAPGLFLVGKFDQLARDVPYGTLAQAFQAAIVDIVASDAASRESWRQAILQAVGGYGALLFPLLPALAEMIGNQPELPDLPPHEARSRHNRILFRFIQGFSRQAKSLTIFLDDLQWIDQATLELFERLASEQAIGPLLLVGAYRDNEVQASHPLASMIERARAAGGLVDEMFLGPLEAEAVNRLLADSLGADQEELLPVAEILREKTAGNPFFVRQLLASLVEAGKLSFDKESRHWRWDSVELAESAGIGIVHLMAAKLEALPKQTKDCLAHFACLGNTVTARRLAHACSVDELTICSHLTEAIVAGLVFRQGEDYVFLHDRVQEAAYRLIPDEDRGAMHRSIGSRLTENFDEAEIEDAIFDIASQLNRGRDCINDDGERIALVAFNLRAGRRAEASTAYTTALSYYHAGATLLRESDWNEHHQTVFELKLRIADCEFLTGEPEVADQRLDRLSQRAISRSDAARVVWAQVTLNTALGRLDRAIALGLAFLGAGGFIVSAHPDRAALDTEFAPIAGEIAQGRVDARRHLAALQDEDSRDTLEVLAAMLPPAFFTDEKLVCLLLCRMANISRIHGNSDASALGYTYLGMVLGPYFDDYPAGYAFGKLGLDLIDSSASGRFRARVVMAFAGHVMQFSRPMRESRDTLRRAFDLAADVGDLTYTGFSTCTLLSNYLGSGEPLPRVEREAAKGLAHVERAKFGLIVDIVTTQLMLVRRLQGMTLGMHTFDDGIFDERAFEAHLEADPGLKIATCWYFIRKMQAHVFEGDFAAALAAEAKAAPLTWTTGGHFELVDYHFYAALAHAGAHDGVASREEGARHLAALHDHHRALRIWADNCPKNFRHHAELAHAEIERIEGRDLAAIKGYEAAIASAQSEGFLHVEALGLEAAAGYCRRHGLATFETSNLTRSYDAYRRWGAHAKLRQFERLRPELRSQAAPAERWPSSGDLGQIDLTSMIRSSEAISSELQIGDLISRIMEIAIVNAGAERGLLILPKGDELMIEAEAVTGPETIEVRLERKPADTVNAPLSLVRDAFRTLAPLIIADTAQHHAHSAEPYLKASHHRSILALPMVRRGKPIGLLLLQSPVPNAFSSAQLAVLRVLASQAAISIESAALEEKDSLLKEVHHRVKNNLQLINSLLNLQAARIEDPAVAELFTESRNRIRSMALVHENLYRAGSFARIAMADHIKTLCTHLQHAYGSSACSIDIKTEIEDVALDLDRAVTLGLILNELVSNALKHAFRCQETGRIEVSLRRAASQRLVLVVVDDGNGLPDGWQSSDTLGMQLVRDLSEQLNAELEIVSVQGSRFQISFDTGATRTW